MGYEIQDYARLALPSLWLAGILPVVWSTRSRDALAQLAQDPLFNHVSDGVLAIGADGCILLVNPQALDLLDMTEAELLGQRFADWIVEPEADASPLLTPRPQSGDLNLRLPKGRNMLVSLDAVDIMTPPVARLLIIRDVGPCRLAEQQSQLMWTTIHHLNDILLVTDAHLLTADSAHILFVNQAFEKLAGIPAAQAMGQDFAHLFPRENRTPELHHIRELLRQGNLVDGKIIEYCRDGVRTWLEVTVAPVQDATGTIHSYVTIGRNVTDYYEALQRLEERERYFLAVFDQNPYPIFLLNLQGQILLANQAALRLVSHDADSLPKNDFSRFILPEELLRNLQAFERVRAGETVQFTSRGQAANDRVLTVDITGVPIKIKDEIIGVAAIIKDVTDLHQMQEHSRLLANALANIAEGALILDMHNRIVWANKAFTTISGYEDTEVLGEQPWMLMAPESGTIDSFITAARRLNFDDRAGYWQGEVVQRRRNGEVYPTLVTMSAVYDEAQQMTHRVVVFNDISRFKQYEARLEYLAHCDALTTLPNRTSFQLHLRNALIRAERAGSRLGLFVIDLDQFKTINDTLGHGIGDDLLKLIAQRLQMHLRKADVLARLGGDEFAVLVEDLASVQAAAQIAEQLREALETRFECEGNELFTSASIGIACYPEDGADAATLLRNADAAMHQAKQEGRNTHRFFSSQIDAHGQEYLLLANNLRYALERRQLYLHYQPCMDLSSNRIVSVEALLRWRHPELGNISPAKFIPIAESTGLIASIGKWVLEEACRQAKQWQNRGYFMRMAVNLSARQFRDVDLLSMIEEILRDNELEAHWLELEITESMLMENPDLARQTLRSLSELGVTIAIDDFGTGYSSLSYLKEFIFNFIKIDQSFVSRLPDDRNDAVITRTIIAMAKNLQIQVIAEGVETEAQRSFLSEYGCDEGQGYLFSKPLPADQLESLMAKLKRGPSGPADTDGSVAQPGSA